MDGDRGHPSHLSLCVGTETCISRTRPSRWGKLRAQFGSKRLSHDGKYSLASIHDEGDESTNLPARPVLDVTDKDINQWLFWAAQFIISKWLKREFKPEGHRTGRSFGGQTA